MNQPWSMVFNFFRSLSLAHLERSLFSLAGQTVKPNELIIYENDTTFHPEEISKVVELHFPGTNVCFDRHGDSMKRNASYAQNKAIRMAKHDTFIFTKADCIFHPTFCERMLMAKPPIPLAFSTSYIFQMPYWSQKGKPHEEVDHASDLESLGWREDVTQLNRNTEGGQMHTSTYMDAPCFCTTKQAMEVAGWYDEDIKSWGYWQMDLQGMMHKRGVRFNVIEEPLMWHMQHGLSPEEGERNLQKAHNEYMALPRRNDPAFQ